MNLTKISWPRGYLPSIDPVNGDPTGLLRMDNCYLDEQGVLSLVPGIQKLTPSSLPYYPYRMYSKVLNGNSRSIWASLGVTSYEVIRTANGLFSDTTVIGYGTDRACFGDCLGEVVCFAGNLVIKDFYNTGVSPQGFQTLPLGLQTPASPTIQEVSQPILNIMGTWTATDGTINTSDQNGAYCLLSAGSSTNYPDIILYLTPPGIVNTYVIDGGVSSDPGLQAPNDNISFTIIPDDASQLTLLRISFLLSDGTDDYQFDYDVSQLNLGSQASSTVSIPRGSFTRVGSGDTRVSWQDVSAVRFTIQALIQINVTVQDISFSGGSQGQISGNYTYVQVNVNNNGIYVAKSAQSTPTPLQTVLNGRVILTPSVNQDAQVNEYWFYRFGNTLDQYYFVGQCGPGGTVTDTQTDQYLLQENIFLNQYLATVRPGDPSGIQDTIYGVEGLFYDRMLYMGAGFIYISDSLNPDAVDTRYTIKAFGGGIGASEKNLWIKKITNNVCILGTNKDLYEITGTFQPLPDGSIDVAINPIGEAHPPISLDVCASQGAIFYVGADGIRQTTGSNSINFSPDLRLLFDGQTRADIPPVVISQFAEYPMAVGKTRFLVKLPLADGSHRIFVYDLINQYWRIVTTQIPLNQVTSLLATVYDELLIGYQNTNGLGDVYFQDQGPGGITDNYGDLISGFPLDLRTVFDANGQPRNRKDTFTLKLIVDTGGVQCALYISKDVDSATYSNYQFVGYFTAYGQTTVYFNLSNFTLGFRYSIRIVDVGSGLGECTLTNFKLYEYTIEYDPRPEQLNYLRIQPSNLGTISRKRIVNYAFVVDTLNNNVTVTPLIDNSASALPESRIINTPVKKTIIYYFQQEQIGTDISAILQGGPFEFYGVNTEEIISEKMPIPCEFLVIPNNDYGTPERKRHSSYKFQINTNGQNVLFTPKLDGVFYTPQTYNTTEKRIVEYFFTSDTIAREVGGTLQSETDIPFEFYGTVTPQKVEVLPPRLTYFRIPNDNFGIAAPKRVRVIPMVIDTGGQNVIFNPIVDGADPSAFPAVFNTIGKTTVFYYFSTDSFGTDYGGELIADTTTPFEFYGFGQPENVERLPVAKIYDQLGPVRFDKIAKLFLIRLRIISPPGNTTIPITIFGDDSPTITPNSSIQNTNALYTTNITVIPNTDYIYEIQLPKSINSAVVRITLGACTYPFYRFDCQLKVSISGMESESQWIPISSGGAISTNLMSKVIS